MVASRRLGRCTGLRARVSILLGPGGLGPGQAGFTLMEVVVATAVMSIFMAMFTTGIVQMYAFVNRNEVASTAQAQASLAFERLESDVRYAAGISDPGTAGGDPVVEFLTINTGSRVCTQVRLHTATSQLQRRRWGEGASPLQPTAWESLAWGVSGATPFTVSAPTSSFTTQRLLLVLTATNGNSTATTTRQLQVTLTASNTDLGTSSAAVCTEGRAIP